MGAIWTRPSENDHLSISIIVLYELYPMASVVEIALIMMRPSVSLTMFMTCDIRIPISGITTFATSNHCLSCKPCRRKQHLEIYPNASTLNKTSSLGTNKVD